MPDEAIAKACCADLYQSDIARLILGDTLHPGGLALSNRLGRLMGIKPSDWVVDLASGQGSSTIALSTVFHCRILGIEFGRPAVTEAQTVCAEAQVAAQAFFIQGDAERPPLRPTSIDAVVCECSMSIFANKGQTIQQVMDSLRPGGRLGLSDVTVEPGSLPPELDGVVGQILCLSGALNADGYAKLLVDSGMTLEHQEDASSELLKLLAELEIKVDALMAWQNVSQPHSSLDQSWLSEAPGLISKVKQLVVAGQLGYWLFVAQKPI